MSINRSVWNVLSCQDAYTAANVCLMIRITSVSVSLPTYVQLAKLQAERQIMTEPNISSTNKTVTLRLDSAGDGASMSLARAVRSQLSQQKYLKLGRTSFPTRCYAPSRRGEDFSHAVASSFPYAA